MLGSNKSVGDAELCSSAAVDLGTKYVCKQIGLNYMTCLDIFIRLLLNSVTLARKIFFNNLDGFCIYNCVCVMFNPGNPRQPKQQPKRKQQCKRKSKPDDEDTSGNDSESSVSGGKVSMAKTKYDTKPRRKCISDDEDVSVSDSETSLNGGENDDLEHPGIKNVVYICISVLYASIKFIYQTF